MAPKHESYVELIKRAIETYGVFVEKPVERAVMKALDALDEDLAPHNGEYDPTPDAIEVYDDLAKLLDKYESEIEDDDDEDDDDDVEEEEDVDITPLDDEEEDEEI